MNSRRRGRRRPKRRSAHCCSLASWLWRRWLAVRAYLYFSTLNIQSTDDAYTDGRAVTIAPQVSGTSSRSTSTTTSSSSKGDPLIHIDPRQYQSATRLGPGRARPAPRRSSPASNSAPKSRGRTFPAQLAAGAGPARVGAGDCWPRRRPITTASAACRKQATTQQEIDAAKAALRQAQGAGRARRGAGGAGRRPCRSTSARPTRSRPVEGPGRSRRRRSSIRPN